MVTAVKKLMNKHAANRNQSAFGSWQPQFGSKKLGKAAAQDVPPPGFGCEAMDAQPRDGGLHPETHADDVAKREMVEIYNRYIAVYDKVSISRKRSGYYRSRKTIMMPLNQARLPTADRHSLVERILRDAR